ncbi:hypothetical protein PMZ80_009630 [Knufia obscura]|uniref:Uncharacterized protein n=2 Tax=Knufia TaxID=430999 RepID=A0AAN8F4G4_9EURO|nr:hypothetical protein PMZ80_009630 [Knufia obscura]KAK5951086.1 hypothetical protein OHC33_007839 [Knufia fluminis]
MAVIQESMIMIKKMGRNVGPAVAQGALDYLKKALVDLRNACKNPDPDVPKQMIESTLRFAAKTEMRCQGHTQRLLGQDPIDLARSRKRPNDVPQPFRKSKKEKKAARKAADLAAQAAIEKVTGRYATRLAAREAAAEPAGYSISTEVIDLTANSSEDDTHMLSSKADATLTTTPPVAALHANSRDIISSHQPEKNDEKTVQTDSDQPNNKEDHIDNPEEKLRLISKEQNSIVSLHSGLPETTEKADAISCSSTEDIRIGGGRNETDVMRDLLQSATEQADISFFRGKDGFLNALVEVSMARRDHELWYDPSMDFKEDLLP